MPSHLLLFTPREEVIEARSVDLTVRVSGSDRDPLHTLGCGAVHQATLYRLHIFGGKLPPVPVAPVSPLSLLRMWSLRFG